MGECKDNSCGTQEVEVKESSCCNFAETLQCIADEAWSELLKEKIKQSFEKQIGSHMDNIAEIVAEASIKAHKIKFQEKSEYKEYKEKLKKAFKS